MNIRKYFLKNFVHPRKVRSINFSSQYRYCMMQLHQRISFFTYYIRYIYFTNIFAVPSKIKNLQVLFLSNTSVTLTWIPISLTGKIEWYNVTLQVINICKQNLTLNYFLLIIVITSCFFYISLDTYLII